MSARSTASSNPILTDYASGVAQDRASALAEFLAPTVVVPSTVGHFKQYDDLNASQVFDAGRAIGGPARRIEFGASDPTYNCKPQALEITIDDAERDADGGQLALEKSRVDVLIGAAVLSHEKLVLDTIKAGVAAVAGAGNWSNSDIDPIDQIDAAIAAITESTGRMPNRMAIGLGAWRKIRAHPKVKARLSGVKASGFTENDLVACLLNPAIEMRVGVLVYSTTKAPATKNNTNVLGDEVFIFSASASPSTYDPSFAKSFRGGRGSVDSVRTYRSEPSRSDVVAVDWSIDVKVVSASLVRRITVT